MQFRVMTIFGMIFQNLNYGFAAQRPGNSEFRGSENCTTALELVVPETNVHGNL